MATPRGTLDFANIGPTRLLHREAVGHEREGFIWQKLREPRSYDYKKTENKGYNERLRMPKFNVSTTKQREAVITFVLGLVAEPPASQYVYKRDAAPQRDRARLAGHRQVQLHRLPHVPDGALGTGLRSRRFSDPPTIDDYAFLKPHFTPQQIEASQKTDRRGLRHATLIGMPVDDKTASRHARRGRQRRWIRRTGKRVLLLRAVGNVLINGQSGRRRAESAGAGSRASKSSIPPFGGLLGARLLIRSWWPKRRKTNPNAKADEAWGWLPPPLVGEGRKVQTAWLHDFLLDPYPIRPAVVLRMPKFNMSSDEASDAGRTTSRRSTARTIRTTSIRAPRESTWPAEEAEHPHRWRRAEDHHRQQLLREVPPDGRLHADRQRSRQGPASGSGLQAAAARLHARLDRQSQADAALHRHAGQHSVRQAGEQELYQGTS